MNVLVHKRIGSSVCVVLRVARYSFLDVTKVVVSDVVIKLNTKRCRTVVSVRVRDFVFV